jgi:hypothetical protein
MIRILVLTLALISSPASSQPKGVLENPADGDYSSGIYMFSGWVCEAEEVEIYLESLAITIKAAYGTEREDTQGACGDSDNGFGLLVNMSLLGSGEQTAVAFADGQEFGRTTFNVQRLSTGEFLRGARGLALEYNFPSQGREVHLEWVQSAQNFLITREMDTPDPLDVSGGWYSDTFDMAAHISSARFYLDREELWATIMVDGENWNLFEGYIKGTTARLQTVSPYGANVDATIEFSDATTAIVTINSCFNTADYFCLFSAGDQIAIRKIVGNNAGRAAPLFDDEQLVPVGGLSEDDLPGE